ncbi:uncharacterized protein LOC62_03G005153 [Vanrija pseudolonga]|uniref:Uncharacterized protein n=1 Tax=Vanrija pseudolonga TaxID=143232 RepID=A0AAF1BL07_9TREE|nr:hypothetical protein LOC62_03G005153 [Vanrija pseudolonga]
MTRVPDPYATPAGPSHRHHYDPDLPGRSQASQTTPEATSILRPRTTRPREASESPEPDGEDEDAGPKRKRAKFTRANFDGLSPDEVEFLLAMKDTGNDHFVLTPAAACSNCQAMNWPCVSRISGLNKWGCVACTSGLKCSHTNLRHYRYLASEGVSAGSVRFQAFVTLDTQLKPIQTPPADGRSVLTLWPKNPQGKEDKLLKFYLPGGNVPVPPPVGVAPPRGSMPAEAPKVASDKEKGKAEEPAGFRNRMEALLEAAAAAPRMTTANKGTQVTSPHLRTSDKWQPHPPGSRVTVSMERDNTAPEASSSSKPPTAIIPMEHPGRGTYAKLNLILRALGSRDTSDPNRSYYTFAPCAVDCPRCYAIELRGVTEDTLTANYNCKFFDRVTHLDHHIIKLLNQVSNKRNGYTRQTPIPAYLYEAKVPCVCCTKSGSRCLHAEVELWTQGEGHNGQQVKTASLCCLACELNDKRCVWARNDGEAPKTIRVVVERMTPPQSVGEMLEELGAIECDSMDG